MCQGDPPIEDPAKPFDFDLSLEVCDRTTRLAKALFGAVDAQVILVKDGWVWRSRELQRYPLGPGVGDVVKTGEPMWIADGLLDARFADADLVVKPPYLRFFAAHPIRLVDGTIPGVIAISGVEPRPYQAALAGRLADLAAFIADEWDRAQAAKAKAVIELERETAGALLTATFQAMPVSLVIADRDYRVIACSPRWSQDMEITGEAARGQSIAVLAPDYFQPLHAHVDRALAGEHITADKVPVVRKDGTPGWLAAELVPWRLPDGQIGGAIISTHDVTRTIEALDAASRSEERLTLALELAGVHVWEMDYVRRELVKVGDETPFFTEPKTYRALFKDIYCTIDPRDRPAVEALTLGQFADDRPLTAEYRLHRTDGVEIWASSACRLIVDADGRPVRLIGAMQNITERRQAEAALVLAKTEAEAASRAKSAFLATMSHEIRTPLNGVLGMAQAMAAETLSSEQRTRLDVIRHSGETLLAILNDILDLSKIEAGRLELEHVDFDLGELARGATSAFAAVATGKGLTLDLEIEDAARGVYLGDCTRVRQILHNLISNALKFTDHGGVTLSIAPMDHGLRFVISDTGAGIPADRLPHLFQKFEQVDASTTRRYGGTGLGLAICRELAEVFGGSIEAQSVEGSGSRFTVVLPLVRQSGERPAAAPSHPTERPQPEHQALQVLAAEDNSVNQLVLKTLLNQAGVDPFIVSDGAEAVAAWRERDWDLILMDVQMPVMDGPKAAALIRQLEAATGRRRTPIIALTANAMAHQVAEYRSSGMDGYVAKPIQIELLFAAMDAALDQAEPPAEARSQA